MLFRIACNTVLLILTCFSVEARNYKVRVVRYDYPNLNSSTYDIRISDTTPKPDKMGIVAIERK